MINKRLISEIGPSIRYVRKNAVCQWMMLVLNIAVTGSLCVLLTAILEEKDRSRTAGGSRIVLVGSDRAAMEIKLHGGCLR